MRSFYFLYAYRQISKQHLILGCYLFICSNSNMWQQTIFKNALHKSSLTNIILFVGFSIFEDFPYIIHVWFTYMNYLIYDVYIYTSNMYCFCKLYSTIVRVNMLYKSTLKSHINFWNTLRKCLNALNFSFNYHRV